MVGLPAASYATCKMPRFSGALSPQRAQCFTKAAHCQYPWLTPGAMGTGREGTYPSSPSRARNRAQGFGQGSMHRATAAQPRFVRPCPVLPLGQECIFYFMCFFFCPVSEPKLFIFQGDCKAQQSSVAPEAGSRGCDPGTYLAADSNSGLTEPKKLPNPVRESKTHQELHRELLFSHRRGLLPEHKPELQKVLETRRFKQLKQQQESQRPRTDLEEELRKQHRMQEQESTG
ncbi:unnamed protein product [Natator depressus]